MSRLLAIPAPCQVCGTLGGKPRKGQTVPQRVKGCCRACYDLRSDRHPSAGFHTDPNEGWTFGDYHNRDDYQRFVDACKIEIAQRPARNPRRWQDVAIADYKRAWANIRSRPT